MLVTPDFRGSCGETEVGEALDMFVGDDFQIYTS